MPPRKKRTTPTSRGELRAFKERLKATLGEIARSIAQRGAYRRVGEIKNFQGIKGTHVVYDVSVRTLTSENLLVKRAEEGYGWKPLVDVFDKKDHFEVVAELPGVMKLNDVKINIVGDMLIISVNTPSRKYRKEVKLPASVKADAAKVTYKSGILEVKIKK